MKLWLIVFYLHFCRAFLLPIQFMGTWSPTKPPQKICQFIIGESNISVLVNQGQMDMKLKHCEMLNPNRFRLKYEDLQIIKIPESINLQRMTKTIPIISYIKKKGLLTEIEMMDHHCLKIYYYGGDQFTGTIHMYKCEST